MSPKTHTAQTIAGVQSIQFARDHDGNVTAINVNAEVNYGTFGLNESANIWPNLNTAQRGAAQQFYDKLIQVLDNIYID